jgi:hypothetical protein
VNCAPASRLLRQNRSCKGPEALRVRPARAKGVKMGRKPKLTPYQIKEARQRIAKGELMGWPSKEAQSTNSDCSRNFVIILDFCTEAGAFTWRLVYGFMAFAELFRWSAVSEISAGV